MNALALVTLCLTVGELHALDGLPSHAECERCLFLAIDFCADLERWQPWRPDDITPVLADAKVLREWWRAVHIGTGTGGSYVSLPNNNGWLNLDLGGRLNAARIARQQWDWKIYGLPPVWPYWRLPVWRD